MKLCDIIRTNIKRDNLQNYKVANDLGLSPSAVTMYISGRKVPSIKVVLGMRHVYGWKELDPYIATYNGGIQYLKQSGFTDNAIMQITGATLFTYLDWVSGVHRIPMSKIDKLLEEDILQ